MPVSVAEIPAKAGIDCGVVLGVTSDLGLAATSPSSTLDRITAGILEEEVRNRHASNPAPAKPDNPRKWEGCYTFKDYNKGRLIFGFARKYLDPEYRLAARTRLIQPVNQVDEELSKEQKAVPPLTITRPRRPLECTDLEVGPAISANIT